MASIKYFIVTTRMSQATKTRASTRIYWALTSLFTSVSQRLHLQEDTVPSVLNTKKTRDKAAQRTEVPRAKAESRAI